MGRPLLLIPVIRAIRGQESSSQILFAPHAKRLPTICSDLRLCAFALHSSGPVEQTMPVCARQGKHFI